MLGRGNTRWESVFAEVGKGEEDRNFWLNRREKKAVMSVSQATCSKIKDHPDSSQGLRSPQSSRQVCCLPGLSILRQLEHKKHSSTKVTHNIEVRGKIP